MSFPNLTPTPNSSGRRVLHASATGVPINGVNTFDIGIDLLALENAADPNLDDWITIRVWALGTSVLGASYAGRLGNLVFVNFQQTGVDPCFVEAEVTHSLVR